MHSPLLISLTTAIGTPRSLVLSTDAIPISSHAFHGSPSVSLSPMLDAMQHPRAIRSVAHAGAVCRPLEEKHDGDEGAA